MKVVLKVDMHDERDKKKAMKAVSGLTGIDSIIVDMKDGKITLAGDIDPVQVVAKLRKQFQTDIVSVGPAKEPEKKKEESNKDQDNKQNPAPVLHYPPYYHNHAPPQYFSNGTIQNDHDHDSCVIC